MTRPPALGTPRDVTLSHATVRCYESGPSDGPPVVFVHGLLVNADLWQFVVPRLAEAGLRCIAVDWPLGSHDIPVPDADLTPPGVADLVAELLEVLDLRDVTVVGNDSGGAITQILITRHPERVGRVVLTPVGLVREVLPAPVRGPPDRGSRSGSGQGADPGTACAVGAAVADRVRLAHQASDARRSRGQLPALESRESRDPQGHHSLPPNRASPAHARGRREAGRVRQASAAGLGTGGPRLPDLAGRAAGRACCRTRRSRPSPTASRSSRSTSRRSWPT